MYCAHHLRNSLIKKPANVVAAHFFLILYDSVHGYHSLAYFFLRTVSSTTPTEHWTRHSQKAFRGEDGWITGVQKGSRFQPVNCPLLQQRRLSDLGTRAGIFEFQGFYLISWIFASLSAPQNIGLLLRPTKQTSALKNTSYNERRMMMMMMMMMMVVVVIMMLSPFYSLGSLTK